MSESISEFDDLVVAEKERRIAVLLPIADRELRDGIIMKLAHQSKIGWMHR